MGIPLCLVAATACSRKDRSVRTASCASNHDDIQDFSDGEFIGGN